MSRNTPIVVDHPVLQDHLLVLRDEGSTETEFRAALEACTYVLLTTALASLETVEMTAHTPLAIATGQTLARDVAFVPILRAGLGMLGPVRVLIPSAKIFMAGLYRDEQTLDPVWYRRWLPTAYGHTLDWFILDPMLATGGSAAATIEAIKDCGGRDITLVGLIAAPEGLTKLAQLHPDVQIVVAAVDKRLTTVEDAEENPQLRPGYIVPGLGDAGDRLFNT